MVNISSMDSFFTCKIYTTKKDSMHKFRYKHSFENLNTNIFVVFANLLKDFEDKRRRYQNNAFYCKDKN